MIIQAELLISLRMSLTVSLLFLLFISGESELLLLTELCTVMRSFLYMMLWSVVLNYCKTCGASHFVLLSPNELRLLQLIIQTQLK